MMREKLVFGPISSRRLGASLGINLMPEEGKLCNFDCVYCECGWNRDGLGDRRLPTVEQLRQALEARLEECRAQGTSIDSITFSGDGEPTLHPDFPAMVDVTLALRDRLAPSSRVSVLSNATRTGVEEVFQALRRVDNPILKLDAATDAMAAAVNRPSCAYSVRQVVAHLERFQGDFVLQTMFLKGPGIDSTAPEHVAAWCDLVRKLRPREVMVYTIDRETPMKGLEKVSEQQMKQCVQPLLDEGFKIQIRG